MTLFPISLTAVALGQGPSDSFVELIDLARCVIEQRERERYSQHQSLSISHCSAWSGSRLADRQTEIDRPMQVNTKPRPTGNRRVSVHTGKVLCTDSPGRRTIHSYW